MLKFWTMISQFLLKHKAMHTFIIREEFLSNEKRNIKVTKYRVSRLQRFGDCMSLRWELVLYCLWSKLILEGRALYFSLLIYTLLGLMPSYNSWNFLLHIFLSIYLYWRCHIRDQGRHWAQGIRRWLSCR